MKMSGFVDQLIQSVVEKNEKRNVEQKGSSAQETFSKVS
ncbi:hypothetical protein CDIMF43_170034 [Carnobacterium divergens]|nr:hypothetical protein CDIMF43_170034 [Carnobacterium divergens]